MPYISLREAIQSIMQASSSSVTLGAPDAVYQGQQTPSDQATAQAATASDSFRWGFSTWGIDKISGDSSPFFDKSDS